MKRFLIIVLLCACYGCKRTVRLEQEDLRNLAAKRYINSTWYYMGVENGRAYLRHEYNWKPGFRSAVRYYVDVGTLPLPAAPYTNDRAEWCPIDLKMLLQSAKSQPKVMPEKKE